MRFPARLVGAVALGINAMLPGCGGGGGSGGSNPPPAPVVVATADELVLPTDGAAVFRGEVDSTPTVWPYLNTVERKENSTAGEFTLSSSRSFDDAPDASPYRLTARGLERFELGAWQLEWPRTLRAGETTVTMDRVAGTIPDQDLDGKPETLEISERLEVLGTRMISTRIALFPDTVGLRRSRTMTVTRTAGGVRTATSRIDTWYARGVGPVRRERLFTDPFGVQRTMVEDLVGLRAGARVAGISPPTTVRFEPALTMVSAAAASLGNQALVAISHGGTFDTTPAILGSLIDSQGAIQHAVTLLDPEPVQLFLSGNTVDLAAGGGRYMLLVYIDGRLRVRLVDPLAPTSAQPARLVAQSIGQNEIKSPRIAYAGGRFLVAWIENFPSTSLKGQFVAPDGALDGGVFTIQALDIRQLRADQLAIGVGPDQMLLAFESYRDEIINNVAWQDPSVRALRVGFDGVALDAQPIVIADADRGQGQPDVAWYNGAYWVTWLDSRDPTLFLFDRSQPLKYAQPYVGRVRPDGTLVDGDAATGGKRISSEGTFAGELKLRATANGLIVARYVRPLDRRYGGYHFTYMNDDATPVVRSQALEVAANAMTDTTTSTEWSFNRLLLFELPGAVALGAWVGPRDANGVTPGRADVVYLRGPL